MATVLRIEIFDPDADVEGVDRLTHDLRAELLELDVDSVSPPVTGPAPPGSKGLELAAIGALLVQVKGSAQVVASVVGLVRSWLQRGRLRDPHAEGHRRRPDARAVRGHEPSSSSGSSTSSCGRSPTTDHHLAPSGWSRRAER